MTESLETCLLEVDDPEWLPFIEQHQSATIFHHPAWISTISESYGYRPFYLVMRDADGSIRAGLPLMEIAHPFQKVRWVSLPFTDCVHPLFTSDFALKALKNSLPDFTSQHRVNNLEIRSNLFAGSLISTKTFVHTTLECSQGAEEVRKHIKGNDLRKLNVALRNGVETSLGESDEFVDAFYQLHLETRHRHGLPVQPRSFFRWIQNKLLQKDYGFISLARIGKEAVAGALFLHWNGTMIYKYAATSQMGRQTYASDPVVWQAIEWACMHGIHCLDWGRTDLEDEGIRRFKNRWGSMEQPLNYYSTHFELEQNWKRQLTRLVRQIVSRSPVAVSRFSGEALYRFFG